MVQVPKASEWGGAGENKDETEKPAGRSTVAALAGVASAGGRRRV